MDLGTATRKQDVLHLGKKSLPRRSELFLDLQTSNSAYSMKMCSMPPHSHSVALLADGDQPEYINNCPVSQLAAVSNDGRARYSLLSLFSRILLLRPTNFSKTTQCTADREKESTLDSRWIGKVAEVFPRCIKKFPNFPSLQSR